MSVQRIRLEFSKGERVRYISHLDVLRYWERAFRRAGLPLSYSQGFTPHPKITFAAPLPLGFTAEAELLDALFDERRSLDEVARALRAQATEDISIVSVREVAVSLPALQASLAWADYRLLIDNGDANCLSKAAAHFMAAETFEWVESRKDKERRYDIRSGVASFHVEESDGAVIARMRLSANQDFTVRPEQVVAAALGEVEPSSFIRERLVLNEPSPAREAWRRRGRYLDERR